MRVVLLMGPSSVGKSTLCNKLAESHGWKQASIDTAIFLMDRKSDLINLKPELERQVESSGLSNIMFEREILNLCVYNKLSLSKAPNIITDYQFLNSQLTGLEEVLKSAGFSEDKSETLSKHMREAVNIGLDLPLYMLYDIVFSVQNKNETVVVDIFPLPNGVLSVLEDFNVRAEKFRTAHSDIDLTTYTVLAYCPPQFLSHRIHARNQTAREEGRPSDLRVGLFPFEQLSAVLTASTSLNESLQTLTTNELFNIVKKHGTSSKDGPIFIEEPIDPSIINDNLHQSVTTETPRIGTKEEINDYRMLRDKFGFLHSNTLTLTIRDREAFDVIIDTSKDSPDSLASTLMADLDLISARANIFRRP